MSDTTTTAKTYDLEQSDDGAKAWSVLKPETGEVLGTVHYDDDLGLWVATRLNGRELSYAFGDVPRAADALAFLAGRDAETSPV